MRLSPVLSRWRRHESLEDVSNAKSGVLFDRVTCVHVDNDLKRRCKNVEIKIIKALKCDRFQPVAT